MHAVVVPGAGASYDCFVKAFSGKCDPEWRPPLARELFAPVFHPIIEKYEGIDALASEYALRYQRTSETIEQFLRFIQQDEDGVPGQFAAFLRVPYYIQEVLLKCSLSYLPAQGRTASAYSNLYLTLFRFRPKLKSISVVTPNFDLIQDHVVEMLFGCKLNRLDAYTNIQGFLNYIKHNGSVNWQKRFLVKDWQFRNEPVRAEEVISRLRVGSDISGELDHKIEVISSERLLSQLGGSKLHTSFYPALSVPVEDKSHAVCPKSHIEALRRSISGKDIVLIFIGFSGGDGPIIDLINECHPKVQGTMIIGADVEDAKKTGWRLQDDYKLTLGPIVRPLGGFSDTSIGAVEAFLADVQKRKDSPQIATHPSFMHEPLQPLVAEA